MLSAQEAEDLILRLVPVLDRTTEVERLGLATIAGRILAAPIVGPQDFPYWDNSAMDGYGVRYADVEQCSADHPVTLEVVTEIAAGKQPQVSLQSGQAARIFTGAMLPTGADTVVMQEDTQRSGDRVTILTSPQPQSFVRHRGDYYRAGDPLLPAGIRLGAPELAVLATVQCLEVPVFRLLRVAVFSTGSELLTPDRPLQPGQIVDSNQIALTTLIAATGAEPLPLGIVPDRPDALKATIAQASLQADVILSSGGVSVGDYDYVDRVLAELGATLHLRAVAVRPGKPLTVATLPPAPHRSVPVLYFGLPGNPGSALVSFWRFVQPALRKQSGLAQGWQPVWVKGRSQQPLPASGKRETYVWGRVQYQDGEYEFSLAEGAHSSGNLMNLAQTNALAKVPVGQAALEAGDRVQIMLIA